MIEHADWLSQGDIFNVIPHVVSELRNDGTVEAHTELGFGVLVTHGCDLDKLKRGKPQVERLQFLPLRDLSMQNPDRAQLLRREEINPPEALYLGEIPGAGESYALLSEMFTLPADYFVPSLQHFPGDDQTSLVATVNDTRIGMLEEERVELLHQKVVAFWPRAQVQGP